MANQGGTHDQHVKAGQQSHKGSDKKPAGGRQGDDSKRGSGTSSDKQEKASKAGDKDGKR